MNPSVFNNIAITSDEVYKKYTNVLSTMGDKLSNTQKFGIPSKVDKLDFIRIKNLLPYIKTTDNKNFNNCINDYKSEVLHKFNNVVS